MSAFSPLGSRRFALGRRSRSGLAIGAGRWATFALAAIVVVTPIRLLAAQADSGAPQASAEGNAFRAVCGGCHDPSVVEGPLRSPGQWDAVISLMQSYGANGTDEQLVHMRSYLVRNHGQVNINSDPASDIALAMDSDSTIGEAVAAYRAANGAFKSTDDLKKVPGVDPAKLDLRKDRILTQ